MKNLRENGTTFIIISHYDRLVKMINPERTVVIVNGTIAVEGDGSLATKISANGYGFIEKEYGVKIGRKERPAAPACGPGTVNIGGA